MKGIKEQKEMDELRRRLYERRQSTTPSGRHDLTSRPQTTKDEWTMPVSKPTPAEEPADRQKHLQEPDVTIKKTPDKPARRYRFIILLVSIMSFVLVVVGTSLYLLLGGNQMSGANISVNVTGPLAVGGGEEVELDVAVQNSNQSPIQSAVLIVQYPSGTRSADEAQRIVFEERIPINQVGAGETVNVPVRAIMFGEENEERRITMELEYRMIGSGGTFSRAADPFVFRISSSPLVINVRALERVSAGQTIDVTLELRSNSTAPLRDILVSANYPSNFDYTRATPSPSHRTSEWLIPEISPSETQTIVITGVVVGRQDEEFQIQLSAGAPQQASQFTIGSVLANATADFIIERPFIEVGVAFNNQRGEVVTLPTGNQIDGVITVRNTLSDTLYNLALQVDIRGNVLRRQDITVRNGFYDSVADTIRWDSSGDSALQQISPGETKQFTFSVDPNEEVRTPTFALTANAYARRVSERNATEQLVGTAESEVRFTSAVTINRQAGFVSGPVPPVADEETVYSITLAAGAGGNDITGAVVTSALPQYVSWKGISEGNGDIEFNPVSQELTWTIGNVTAGERAEVTFQVGLRPSQNQIGSTPALLGTQRLRATDRFTNDVVRAENVPISTELSSEVGFAPTNGEVVAESVETNNESE